MTVIQAMKKINKRIPGDLPPPPKTEVDGKIENLSIKTVPELLDLRERQLKILNNKSFVNKLADKGEKIRILFNKLDVELKNRQEEEQTCRLFSHMKINNTIDKETVENVEWEGKIQKNSNIYLDSDDDSDPEDVLHILSQSTAQEKNVMIMQPDKPLISADDLVNIGEIPIVKKIVEKTEKNIKPKITGQFKPYKTTVSDVHNPEKEIHRKRNKYWEVTAATPPPIVHGPAQTLSLEESLKLQQQHNKHMKEIEIQHAADKLLSRANVKMAELPHNVTKFGSYRVDSDDTRSDESDPEGSDKEVLDEEPERGGVVFTVMK